MRDSRMSTSVGERRRDHHFRNLAILVLNIYVCVIRFMPK